jgi:hypothetical protein
MLLKVAHRRRQQQQQHLPVQEVVPLLTLLT